MLRDARNGEFPMQIITLLVAIAAVTISPLATYAETVDPAQAIAQKFSEASDEKPAPPSQRKYDGPDKSYEADMLERARAEEHERQLGEARQVVAKSADIFSGLPLPPRPALPPQAAAPEAKLAALPLKPAAEPPAARPNGPGPDASSATILLVLDPDGSGLGFKPDPIICIDDRCWISNGIGLPARAMPRNEAVALQGTDGVTQDSCSGKSGCVYRNVTIDPAARIDVIEVGEGGGASAGAYTVAPDKSCRKEGEALICDNGLATANFHIWAVPETTANEVGVSRLENAVAEGLPEFDVSSANDK
jgi:hypothetical protein